MADPIRVLHILQRMEAGGTQTLLMNIYRNIDRTKVQFDFLVHYQQEQFYDKEILELGGRIYKLTVREDYNFIKYNSQLKKFFKEHKEYKVIHGHMYTLGIFYLHAAKKNGIPTRIAHSHNNASEKNLKWYLKKIMAQLFKLDATELFACSEEAGRYLFGNSKFTVLKNAIDTNKFIMPMSSRETVRNELKVDNRFVIGHVGRFQQQKNHKFIVDIFKEIKTKRDDAVLLLIGTGDLEEDIKEKFIKLGLMDSVKFLGNRSDMPRLYQAMDVFLFPSLFEGLGIVSIEAQAAGIPTVCSDTLPREANISPLFYSVSLDKQSKEWAKIVIEAIDNIYAHQNMYNCVVKAGFEIKTVAKDMEEYYVSKYEVAMRIV